MTESAPATNFAFDVEDICSRAERGRVALLSVVSRVSDDAFGCDRGDEWSPARILLHVVWTEHYWTLLLEALLASVEQMLVLDAARLEEIAREASRLTGSPQEPLVRPPPYDSREEATAGLAQARERFMRTVRAMTRDDVERGFAHARRGRVHPRFGIEHVIEHDWDHAVQIPAYRT
jgi:hypothetical protein